MPLLHMPPPIGNCSTYALCACILCMARTCPLPKKYFCFASNPFYVCLPRISSCMPPYVCLYVCPRHSPNMPQFRGFHSTDLAKCFLMVSFSSQTDQISPHVDHFKVPLSPNIRQISRNVFEWCHYRLKRTKSRLMLTIPKLHYPQTCPNFQGFHSTDLAKCF